MYTKTRSCKVNLRDNSLSSCTGAVAGDAAPLRVAAIGFSVRQISQTNCIAGQRNSIIIRAALNEPIDSTLHMQLAIAGLVNTQTPSGSYPINISEYSANVSENARSLNAGNLVAKCFENYTTFNSITGTLLINTTTHKGCNNSVSLPAGTVFIFTFDIVNTLPFAYTDGAAVTAKISMTKRTLGGTLVLLSQNMDNDETSVLTHIIGAKPGDAAPLRIRAGWALAKIVQSSAFPDINNTITVSLATFNELQADAEIFLTGLSGTLTQISGLAFSESVWGDAEWESSGSLRMVTSDPLFPNKMYVFSFTLLNPASAQEPSSISIFSMLPGSPLRVPVAMETDSGLLLPYAGSKAGDAVPLRVRARGFAIKMIGQSTSFPGASNLFCVLHNMQGPVF